MNIINWIKGIFEEANSDEEIKEKARKYCEGCRLDKKYPNGNWKHVHDLLEKRLQNK